MGSYTFLSARNFIKDQRGWGLIGQPNFFKGRGNDSQTLRLTSIENKASAWGLGAGLAAGALTAMAVPSLILSPRDSHGTAAFRLPIACAAGAAAGLLVFVLAGAMAYSIAKRVYLSHQNLKKEAGD